MRIAATFYGVDTPAPPGIILIHRLGADRTAWGPFAQHAQRNGYACLAFDLRGHGESVRRDGERLSYRAFTGADWRAAVQDIDAARRFMGRRGVNLADTAIAGASIGANLALAYAAEHPDVPAVVLVSPGLDYKGIRTAEAIAAYGNRPVLLMTSEGDSYSVSSCTELDRVAEGLCEVRRYPGATHGAPLLDASDSARDQILLWLKPIIGP